MDNGFGEPNFKVTYVAVKPTVPTKEEILNRLAEKKLVKKLEKKEELLSRAVKTLESGQFHMIGIPEDQEIIDYVSVELNKAGWTVTTSKKESSYRNVKSGKEYKKTNVTLHFS